MSYRIESHEDGSVTLEHGALTATIKAGTWHDANAAAHVLAKHMDGRADLDELRLRLMGMISTVEDAGRALRDAEHFCSELATEREKYESTIEPRKTTCAGCGGSGNERPR